VGHRHCDEDRCSCSVPVPIVPLPILLSWVLVGLSVRCSERARALSLPLTPPPNCPTGMLLLARCSAGFGLVLAAEAVLLMFGCPSKTLALTQSRLVPHGSSAGPWPDDRLVSVMMLFADCVVITFRMRFWFGMPQKAVVFVDSVNKRWRWFGS